MASKPAENGHEKTSPKKQPKVDEGAQIDALFSRKPAEIQFDMPQKRLVFKIATDSKDGQNKTTVDNMYKRLMGMNER